MSEELKEATVNPKNQTVACPHCGKKAGGNAVNEAARNKKPLVCPHCEKKFQPIPRR